MVADLQAVHFSFTLIISIYCILKKKKSINHKTYELRYDKTNKMSVHPAKTQISLGIRPV